MRSLPVAFLDLSQGVARVVKRATELAAATSAADSVLRQVALVALRAFS